MWSEIECGWVGKESSGTKSRSEDANREEEKRKRHFVNDKMSLSRKHHEEVVFSFASQKVYREKVNNNKRKETKTISSAHNIKVFPPTKDPHLPVLYKRNQQQTLGLPSANTGPRSPIFPPTRKSKVPEESYLPESGKTRKKKDIS